MKQPAALYVMPDGPYPALLGTEQCWTEERNAKTYSGAGPVVAHPPCGPWSKLRHMCTRQDPTCGPRAFEQVRAAGGVLEHPEHSTLFEHVRAPHPNAPPDEWGGGVHITSSKSHGVTLALSPHGSTPWACLTGSCARRFERAAQRLIACARAHVRRNACRSHTRGSRCARHCCSPCG